MGWLSNRELSTDWSGPLLTLLICKIKRMGENKEKKEEEKGERRWPEKAELLSKCVHCSVSPSARSQRARRHAPY